MPRGDRTGPRGEGPKTGRGAGYCSGSNMPGFANSNLRGFGRGFAGRGFAWRARELPVNSESEILLQPSLEDKTEKQEKQFLEQELGNLKQEMKDIEKRLKELKS
jgi:hypothetical protein